MQTFIVRVLAIMAGVFEYLKDFCMRVFDKWCNSRKVLRAKQIWTRFRKFRQDHPNDWKNSKQDIAFRLLLTLILTYVYIGVFILGVIVISFARTERMQPGRADQQVSMDGRKYDFANTRDLDAVKNHQWFRCR